MRKRASRVGTAHIGPDASAGALLARMQASGTEVTVAFERTANDAKRTKAAYRVFAEGAGTPVDDILSHRGNAVIVWDRSPTNGELSVLEDCLR